MKTVMGLLALAFIFLLYVCCKAGKKEELMMGYSEADYRDGIRRGEHDESSK